MIVIVHSPSGWVAQQVREDNPRQLVVWRRQPTITCIVNVNGNILVQWGFI